MPSAARAAGILRYAAIQFVVLTAAAMVAYAGGTWYAPQAPHYRLSGNFLSDLGATRTFAGHANASSCVLFAIALISIGLALIPFAWAWRGWAFARGRAAIAGHASAGLGTVSGLAFTAIALTPVNLALDAHNAFVLTAFGSLLLYMGALTWAMAANGIRGLRLALNFGYLGVVFAYVLTILFGPAMATEWGFSVQVIAQKIVVYSSMAHVIFLTTTVRRSRR